MSRKKNPLVVLAGRPNVGKSTLFNRLLHSRRAITDPMPGVTRDPIEAAAVIAGRHIRLVDTGGFKLDREDGRGDELDTLVMRRTLECVEEADLVVLIFEAGEITPEDEEFVELLRPHREKLLAVVNKTEGGRREGESWNLLSLGFDELIMISAEHGDRIAELEAAIAGRLKFGKAEDNADDKAEGKAGDKDEEDGGLYDEERGDLPGGNRDENHGARPDGEIALALLGKPNTGKSTLSNRLTSSAASIVSPVPGTTRDVVEGGFVFRNRVFRVLDTAGIRRKSRVSENVEYYSVNRAIKTIDRAGIVFLLIDAREGLTDQDKKIAALACEKGRGVIFVLNKWDLMPAVKNAENAVKDRIRYFFGQMEYAPVVPLSAKDGNGVEELLKTAIRMGNELCRHTDTAILNQALARWLAEHPPPQGPRTRFSVKYAVQVSENPVKFVFFVSRPAAVTEAYKSYLRGKIRKDLGYSMIPVTLEIRPSRKEKTNAVHKR
ncbi:MAG: ribosome biogenesis GTPase Der [Treponema sp.]|jgi:GTP-binding protein|nr:ribosome biogenesis GTPase Der [Treponema sp.]